MRDHYWIDDEGEKVLISDMPMEVIQDILSTPPDEIEVFQEPTGPVSLEDLFERLRIEIIIRELNL